MFYFPCAACGVPVAVTHVHSWHLGHAVCGEACSAAARATGRFDSPPDARAQLAATAALLVETGQLVNSAVGAAGWSEGSMQAASALGSFGVKVAIGSLPGIIAAEAYSASLDTFSNRMYEVDLRLHRIIREMMVLQELGFAVAGELEPMVTRFAGLATSNPAGVRALLIELWEFLRWLYEMVIRLSPP